MYLDKEFELRELWKKDEYLKSLNDLNNITILSLDIFDTLLFRAVEKPSNIFAKVWQEVIDLGFSNHDISPNEFKQIRIEAEKNAIKKKLTDENSKEINLSNIYREIPDIVGNKEKIMMIEVEMEKKFTYPNPSILSLMKFAKESGKNVVLLTDMYLQKSYIEEILEANGIDSTYYDLLLVSNEENMSKREGDLFKKLKSLYEYVDSSHIIHIGDNLRSDYESAVNEGLKALHYNIIPDKINSIYFYEKIRHGVLLEEILSLRKFVSSLNNYSSEAEEVAFKVGVNIIGPFLTFFISWVIEQMQNLNIKRVYPFMREGELLKKLIDNELKDRNLLDYEVRTIHVSRKSTYIPSIKEINKENIEKVIIAKNLSINNLFDIYGLNREIKVFEPYQDLLIKDMYKVQYNDEQNLYEKMIEYLLQENIKSKISIYIEEKRNEFIKYLKQEMGNNFDNIATIDIGYNGTIQTAIENVLKNEELEFQIEHFLAIGGEKVRDKILDNINIRGFISNFSENIDLIRTILLSADVIEQLILSSEGSTTDYEEINGIVKPIKSKNMLNNDVFKDACWNGIFEFQRLWFYFRKTRPDIAENVIRKKREIMMILHRLIDMPTKQEAIQIGNLQYDDNFGSTNVDKLCSNYHKAILNDKGKEHIDRMRIYGYRHICVPWAQGLITIEDEFYYLKKYSEINDFDEYFNIARNIVNEVKDNGINDIVVYGAGEVGSRIIQACKLYGINVLSIVDRKESLWGQEKDGIEIISINEAIEKGYVSFIIGSFAFIDEIKEGILSKFKDSDIVPNIFSA